MVSVSLKRDQHAPTTTTLLKEPFRYQAVWSTRRMQLDNRALKSPPVPWRCAWKGPSTINERLDHFSFQRFVFFLDSFLFADGADAEKGPGYDGNLAELVLYE